MASNGSISFARGAPSPDIMPADELRACADAALRDDPAGALSYGTAAGYAPLRKWIADHHGVDPARVLVTNGSMQADSLLFQHLIEPQDVAIVEAPTYDRTLLMLSKLEAEIMAIPLEADGIDVGGLEAALEAGARPRLAHLIPNFQNPAGCTLSETKRRRMLELASRYDFTIFEDDPYVELRFEGESPPRMLDLDESDRVVYASSFSKTIAPGVRVGYLVGPAQTIAAVTKLATHTYISPNMLAEAVVAEFCRSGKLAANIERVKTALRERRDALAQALRQELPEVRFTPPDGGYFLWVELPDDVEVAKLSEAARDNGVVFVEGTDFLLEGGETSLRLAYSAVTPDEITEGVQRLALAFESVRATAAA